MNDIIMSVNRLEELVQLAKVAGNGFERAAVYAAATSLESEFQHECDESPQRMTSYDMEKVIEVVWHIKAMVGYDVTNNHTQSDHETWALGGIFTLTANLEKQAND